MLYLHQKKNFDERLGGVAEMLLYSFMERKICSTYQCYKDLKIGYENIGKTITYKNVYKRVQQLYESNIIEKGKTKQSKETKHGAIFYKLSSFGIFYSFKNDLDGIEHIISNNKNDELFTLFLYPYFKLETIARLIDSSIIQVICIYLTKCCNLISENYLIDLRELERTGGWIRSLGFTYTLVDHKNKDHSTMGSEMFIRYIRANSDLKWLNVETLKMVEVKRNEEIKIIQDNKELSLKLDIENLKASLYEGDKEKFEFTLKKHGEESYEINGFQPVTIQNYLSDTENITFEYEIKNTVHELILNILQYVVLTPSNKKEEDKKMMDKNALMDDELFVNAINTFKKEIDYYYKKFFN
jgi:hypothetical protein